MSLTQTITSFISSFLTAGGYPVLFILTFLDSTVLPVPNEAIMPFVGSLLQNGTFGWVLVLIISSIGAVTGALTSYAIGYYGAEPFVKKYGRYIRLSQTDLQKVTELFGKHGDKIILISRFIPLVRQFISIPAGAAKMNVWKFVIYTVIGSTLWNSLMLGLGYTVGSFSGIFNQYLSWIDRLIVFGLLCAGIFWIYTKKRVHKV